VNSLHGLLNCAKPSTLKSHFFSPEPLIAFATSTAARELLAYVCVRNVSSDAETT